MFGIGTMEILVILLVAVMVLGPEHLPKLVRTLAKVMSDVRRVSTDFQRAVNLEASQEEWEQKQKQSEAPPKKKKKKKTTPAQTSEAPAPDIANATDEEIPAVYAATDTLDTVDAAPMDQVAEETPAATATADAEAHGDKA